MTNNEREQRRQEYRPETIRVLFIGESPPRKEETFFYYGRGRLSDHTLEGFECVYGKRWDDHDEFLRFFQGCGCFLEDLSHEPINHLGKTAARRAKRRENVPGLASRISDIKPEAVITVMRGIRRNVRNAINQSNVRLSAESRWCLKFPSHGHQREYVKGLCNAIRELRDRGVLPNQA